MPPPDEPPSGPTETRRRRVVAVVAALVLGVVIGVLTSVLQGRLDFPWLALVNAASPWLTTAFVAGALQPRLRTALWAGLGATMLQVVAYYATADLRGFGVSARYLTLWSACAVAGGPVFGVAGHLWRRAAPAGLGAALLVAAWASEAVLVYAVRLGYTSSAVLFGGVAALLALGLAQHRGQWVGVARWSVPAVMAGAAGQALLVLVTG